MKAEADFLPVTALQLVDGYTNKGQKAIKAIRMKEDCFIITLILVMQNCLL